MMAQRFEAHRLHLQAVAYRMLGSLPDADDAVQETWLRYDRADPRDVSNLPGWLTTVVARVSLDVLRSRRARRDQLIEPAAFDPIAASADGTDPEREAVLADSVGRALLVVLNTLSPPERVALVLHDMFAVPFDEIAPIVGRSTVTTKKLASRARQRVRDPEAEHSARVGQHRLVVEAFLAAARVGDINGLLAVLAPDVVRTADPAALPVGVPIQIRGAQAVVQETVMLKTRSRFAEPALINGAVGVIVAPRGQLLLALVPTIAQDRIAEYDVIADPTRLEKLTLHVLDYGAGQMA